MNKDSDKTKEQLLAELTELRKKSKKREEKLNASNQQLEANNQQLQATEQQLRASNQQLAANNQQLIATEQALRKSEEKFRLAFINSPDSVNITRLSDGKLLESSNSFEKITGHKLSDSLGKKTSDLNLWANPGDRELMKEKLSRDGKIENFEFIRKMKNGDTAFSVMSAAIITINNEPHLLSVIRDVDDLKKAEINIRESEVRLKEAELIAQMGNFIWDIKSGDVTWSDGLHALLGYDKSEKIDYNKVNAEIHHPDDLERITAWLNECIASGKSNFPPNEYRLLRKDGKVIQVQTTVKVLLQDDLPHKIIGSVQDITERKQAENAVRQSEERYRLMLNTTLDGFILADEEGKIMQVNPGYCNMIGYSEQELLSMNIRNIEAKLSDQEVKERIQQMVSQGKVRFETRHQEKDGHLIDLEVSVSIFQNDKKQPLVAAFVRDITERKLAEEALKESELKFQKIISESIEAISVVDEEGKIIVWNTALEKITGIKSTETVNRHIWDVQAELVDKVESNPKRKDEIKSTLLDILKTGKAPWLNKVMEREYVHTDGTIKKVSGSMYTIKTQKGYLIVSMSEDVTERKQAEKALKEAQSNLQALLDNRKDSIWSLDRNYNYLVFNKPYADVIYNEMGIRIEKGMNALDIHPKEVADFWKPKFDEVFQGKYVTFEFSHFMDGKEYFFEVLMNPIYTDNKISGLSALSMDITERKQAEEKLKESEERLRLSQKAGQVGIWSVNVNTGEQYLSEVAAGFHGLQDGFYSKDDMFGMVPDEDLPALNQAFQQTVEKASEFNIEHRIINKKTAKVIWVHSRGQAVADSEGKTILVHGTALDITERKLAEEKINETLASLSKAEEISKMGSWNWDMLTGKIHWSDQMFKILGYEINKVKPSYDIAIASVYKDDHELYESKIKDAIENKSSFNFENRIICKENILKWVNSQGQVICDKQNNPIGMFGTVQDITESKEAEEKLKESEEFLSSVFDNSLNSIMVADDLGNYISVNKAAADMFGYTIDEMHKMNVGQINTTTDPDAAKKYKIYLEKGFEIGEFPFVHTNGEARIAQYHAVRVRDNFNLSILSDITDIKNSQKALKESEEKFRNIFQQSPLAIQLYNPEGNLLDVNPKTLELFGLDDKKYISGFNFWNDPNLPEKDAEALKKAKPVYISTTYNFETFGDSIQFPTSRKGLIYVDMYIMPMKSENKIIGYLVHIVEVTDQKLAEKELIKHRDHLEELVNDRTKELQSSNKELEAFSYSVSHDLRAPLRAINGFTRFLMEDYVEKLDDEGKRLGDVIQKNAVKMGNLIDDLLAFSRLGRTSMKSSSIDMKNMANALYHEATSDSERNRIKFSVADLPDAYGDTNMLRQVWMNLISNAIKFSSKREKAVISIAATQDDEKITYRISDNGVGFNMQYVNKIFDVFQRLHTESEYPGTGVGLSLVQRIIIRHKGKIWAESEIDKGATFYFSLPKKG